MTDTASPSPATSAPLPTRRLLRQVEEEAKAAGEGPLTPEEVLRRAQAALAGETDASTAGPPEAHPSAAQPDTSPADAAAPDGERVQPLPPQAPPVPGAPASVPQQESAPSQEDASSDADTASGDAAAEDREAPQADAAPGADSAPAEKDYGRAGRNLPVAVAVGALLGGGVLASLVFLPVSFVAIALLGVCLAMWELSNALKQSGARVSTVSTIVAAGCMVVATALGGQEALWVAFAAGAGAVLLFTLLEDLHRRGNAVRDVCLSLFALTYVGLMVSFVVHLLSFDKGNLLVICFLALVVASDIGGYFAGTALGKHPIAPSISPKKSWEGFAGSVLMATAVGMGMAHWAFEAPLWTGVVLGVVIPAFATLGDFSESMIKRDLGLKDMGTLLPGHGGVMDRLDSILPTAPVALILFIFLPGFIPAAG